MKNVSIPVKKEYTCDVLVAGGGVAGIAAAICSARMGANTILVDSGGVLGGTATKGLVGPFMTSYDRKGETRIIRGFYEELVDRLVAEGSAIHPSKCPGSDSYAGYRDKGHIGVAPFSAEALKRVAETMCQEAGVKLLYHATVVACDTEDNVIRTAYIAVPTGLEAIHATTFVDTTGSSNLAYHAGAETFRGDENGLVQTSSLFFQIVDVNKAVLDEHMAKNADYTPRFFMNEIEEARQRGEFPCGTLKLRIFESMDGVWTVNMCQEDEPVNELDTEAMTQAEINQRKQVKMIFDFLKKRIPGLENIRLTTSGSDLGVRESRRIVGEVMFTAKDVAESAYYDQRIAVCANSMDFHKAVGVEYTAYSSTSNYYIPMGSLISKNIKNLLAAGKNLSADKFAHAAVRVMPPCMAMGEAAGIAAALAVKHGGDPRKVDVKEIQAQILANGGYLE